MAISLIDALSVTEDTRQTFQIKFVSYNHDKQKGGEIIELPRAKRIGAKFNLAKQDMISVCQDNGDHPYPVHIHLILEINKTPVFL